MMRFREAIAEKGFFLCAIFTVSITVTIFGFMVVLGLPLIEGGHAFTLLSKPWMPGSGSYGIYPMIAGTLAIAFLGLAFAFPLSIGCACMVSVLGPRPVSLVLRKVVELMTGIPTVIYGFVGIFLLVPIVRDLFEHGSGMCILTASLMLAILVSPTMILFFSDSFSRVPQSYLTAIDALGGNKVQKLFYVILPCGRNGVVIGLILALGRAIGDTLIALMLAGNATGGPDSLLDSARTLTSHIALVIAADYESLEFKSIFACGMVLYLFAALAALAVRFIGTREVNRK
jgi:phosphate transport system permease protein